MTNLIQSVTVSEEPIEADNQPFKITILENGGNETISNNYEIPFATQTKKGIVDFTETSDVRTDDVGFSLNIDGVNRPTGAKPLFEAIDSDRVRKQVLWDHYITDNIEIFIPNNMGQGAQTLFDALEWLQDRRIARNASVTIRLDNGIFKFSRPLAFTHPQGALIQIRATTPSTVLDHTQLTGNKAADLAALQGSVYFTCFVFDDPNDATGDGIRVIKGGFAHIFDVMFVGDDRGKGVEVAWNSHLRMFNCAAFGFEQGMIVNSDGALTLDAAWHSLYCLKTGLKASRDARVQSNAGENVGGLVRQNTFAYNGQIGVSLEDQAAISLDHSVVRNNGSSGIRINGNGSFVTMKYSSVKDNQLHGVVISNNGTADFSDSVISNNSGHGIYLYDASSLVCNRAVLENSSLCGIRAENCSQVSAKSVSISNSGEEHIFVERLSSIDFGNGSVSGTSSPVDILARRQSQIYAGGLSATVTTSPILNVVGNKNSFITD
ncbi:MAG: right-handed parallel beta-helix repeat-containing protein [Pseudomonadota bacterium]